MASGQLRVLCRIIAWKLAISSRASTSRGTPTSIAAIVTVSAFERSATDRHEPRDCSGRRNALKVLRHRPFRLVDGGSPIRSRHEANHGSPAPLRRRQSSAPLRQPAAHCSSSHGRCSRASSAVPGRHRVRSPRTPCRTKPRLCPVRRTISLMGTPSFASAKMAALVSSRRR